MQWERGSLIVGKEVCGGGRVWMRVNVGISGRLLIVGGFRRGLDETVGILIAVKGVWDFGRVWMRRVNVGIIETERCI